MISNFLQMNRRRPAASTYPPQSSTTIKQIDKTKCSMPKEKSNTTKDTYMITRRPPARMNNNFTIRQ